MSVPDIGKPAQMTCWWTTIHGGCTRQGDKPDPTKVIYNSDTNEFRLFPGEEGKDLDLLACATFKCLWLDSQSHPDETKRMPRRLRPDQSYVMFGPQDTEDETLLHVSVDPDHATAWQKPEIVDFINRIIERGGKIELIVGDSPRAQISEPI